MRRLTLLAGIVALVGCPADVTLPNVTGGAPAQGGSSPTGTGGTAGVGGAGGSAPMDCSELDDPCGLGTWLDGACVRVALDDGTGCDDGLACTTGDHCVAGACVPETPHECVAQDPCHVASCNDATSLCELVPGNDGGPCDDDDACTDGDSCAAGACVPGSPVICLDDDPELCNHRACVPETGCVAAVDHEGEACAPSTACLEFRCAAATPGYGYCSGFPINQGGACDDGSTCTAEDACDSGYCTGQPLPDSTPCDDGISCLVGDVCSSGSCQYGTTQQCTLTSTDACLGVLCQGDVDACVFFADSGSACDSPSPCGGAGTCAYGSCAQAIPENDGAGCDDLDVCTVADQCGAGACAGTPVTTCISGDGCCPAGCISATDSDCGAVLYMASVDGLPGFFAFDLETEVWSTLPEPPSPPRSRLATDGAKVFVLAQDWQLYAYDPSLATWSVERAGPPKEPGTLDGGGHFLSTIAGGFFVVPRLNRYPFRTIGSTWVLGASVGAYFGASGSRDPDSGMIYLQAITEKAVTVVDPTTNDAFLYAVNDFQKEPTSRFGTFWNGVFYTATEASTHQVVKVLPGSNNAVITTLVTADPNPSSDVDPETGLIYLGPSDSAAAFEVFDPVAESLTALPSPPPIPDGYLSSVAIVRAPSGP